MVHRGRDPHPTFAEEVRVNTRVPYAPGWWEVLTRHDMALLRSWCSPSGDGLTWSLVLDEIDAGWTL